MKPLSVAGAAALPSAEVASALGVTPGVGLDPEGVAPRAAEAGVNELRAAVQAAVPVVPALADAFRATALDAGDWALVLGVALAPSVVAHALRVTGRIAVA